MASTGRVAIVTGAAQGIGFAISSALLKEGYKVCLCDVNEEKGKESVASLQEFCDVDRVIFLTCDVSSEEQLEDVFTKTIEKFGPVDVLVNNAGIADEINPKLMVKINLMGPIIGCQMAMKYMSKGKGGPGGGFVINTASMAGILPLSDFPVYCATKHGVVGLTRTYGSEYYFKHSGIAFMTICPYYTRTPLLESARSRAKGTRMRVRESDELIEPEFIAEGVLKLLKEQKNGSVLAVFPGKFVYVGYPEEVCITDVNEERGKESTATLQDLYGIKSVIFLTCDVTSEQQVQDVFIKTIDEFGQVDVLVNNAGIVDEVNPKLTIDINLVGPINGCQTALTYMNKEKGGFGGVVVNVASVSGFLPHFAFPVYTATKHAVIGLTRSLGDEYYLQDSGITFVAICPFYVRTPLLNSRKPCVGLEENISLKVPDPLEPEFVAEGVLKLLREKRNGSTLAVLPGKFIYVGYPEELKHISMY